MSAAEERLRPHPSDRFAGAEHLLDLTGALRSLRAETRPAGANGHRQITLLHRGPVRLVLFAFDEGGRMPQHQAQGWVTIHVMRGVLRVKTPDAEHVLNEGQLLALAPNIRHDVDAVDESDMLLGVYPEGPTGSGAANG
ncbi:MAG TPA: AraC family ligand binding domain-containing protein [Gemmatimonadaceae bacterium]|jgi:quercetin dioxygenase-like cupin family protein|nr:AraC family ligand binding domain-containing protein [Gemmatimonadaceae bacterium]